MARKPAKKAPVEVAVEKAPPPEIEVEPTVKVEEIKVESTDDGRYIPYGGGIMGWFENSGVLKSELKNNYQLHTAMSGDMIRAKQFERWGQNFNRRSSRKRVRRETGVTIAYKSVKVHGTTRDISSHGIRMQFLSEVNVEKGDTVKIQLHPPESKEVLVEVKARVVWEEKIGKIRPVWNIGITMDDLKPEQSGVIAKLMTQN